MVAVIYTATGITGTTSRPSGFAQTKELNAVSVDVCANCASIASSTNLSFGISASANWAIKILDVKGLANSAVDLTASYTSGATTVTTLDSGLTGTTAQASEVVVAAMFEASTQTPTFCSPACTGTFSQVDFQSNSNIGGLTADSFPSATSTFDAFGTISTAAKARGAIVTLK